jgi:hypothetical protein
LPGLGTPELELRERRARHKFDKIAYLRELGFADAAGGYSLAGFRTIPSYPKDLPLLPRHSERAAKGVCIKNFAR